MNWRKKDLTFKFHLRVFFNNSYVGGASKKGIYGFISLLSCQFCVFGLLACWFWLIIPWWTSWCWWWEWWECANDGDNKMLKGFKSFHRLLSAQYTYIYILLEILLHAFGSFWRIRATINIYEGKLIKLVLKFILYSTHKFTL